MARGLRGVKDDLSEIGRHLLDIACFISPLIASTTYADSPPSSPHTQNPNPNPKSPPPMPLVGDISEIGGGLRSGISRLSSVLRRSVAASKERDSRGGGLSEVREEVVAFVRDLVKCPESWVEFPVPVDDDFDISHDQKEHIATVERLAPSLAALRISLCPSFMNEESFWKIYFALLHPKLNKHESELLSTQQEKHYLCTKQNPRENSYRRTGHSTPEIIAQQVWASLRSIIKVLSKGSEREYDLALKSLEASGTLIYSSHIVEEMRMNMKKKMENRVNSDFQTPVADSSSLTMSSKVSAIREGDNEVRAPVPSTATASLQYVDQWFEKPAVTREMDASTYNRLQSSSRDRSEAEDDNIILLKKYKSSSSAEAVSLDNSPFSSYERLQLLEKTCSKDYHDKVLGLQNREATDDESSGWQAVEDSSDFEIVDRS